MSKRWRFPVLRAAIRSANRRFKSGRWLIISCEGSWPESIIKGIRGTSKRLRSLAVRAGIALVVLSKRTLYSYWQRGDTGTEKMRGAHWRSCSPRRGT